MTILVTGANGFIGRHLCNQLTQQGQSVIAMLRRPEQLKTLQNFIRQNGGNAALISAVQADLDTPGLDLRSKLPPLTAIVHLAARFAWGMDTETARRTNTDGALSIAELARTLRCRLIMISGFMLENHGHLRRLGIEPDALYKTDWLRVYRRTGAYEASKLEGALRVREFCRENLVDMIEVQPATVAGHSQSGDLDSAQPLYTLMDNLCAGRLAMIPGTSEHWLPLVSVDQLAAIIAAACRATSPPKRLLALDPNTPNLKGLLGILANELSRTPPTRHLPMNILKVLLMIPGMQTLMNTSTETLDFIQPTRFDTAQTQLFMHEQNIDVADIDSVIRTTAQRFQHAKPSPHLQTES